MDFIEQLPKSDGFTAILVIVDRLSKQSIFIPTYDTIDSPELAKLFILHVFSKHGAPTHVTSDRGSEFVSRFFRALGKALNMNLHFTSGYHPEADGQTERTNQTLEQYLRMYCNYQQDNWSELLPLAEFAYNNAPSDTTGVSPFIGQITTDNGPEVKGAFTKLMDRYGIPQVQILAYNSKANGVVERSHAIIRESIVKACKGQISQWPGKVHIAFFADKITITRSTGFSPFFLLYGVEPVLPLDLFEATFLVQGFTDNMSTEDLLALRIRQLEKREEDLDRAARLLAEMRFKSKEQFERRFAKRISTHEFNPGDFVLMRNSQVEKEMNRKTKSRYLGPFVIIQHTQGGAYDLREVNGGVKRNKVAAFRLVPYIARDTEALQKLVSEWIEDKEEEEEERDDDADNEREDDEEDSEDEEE